MKGLLVFLFGLALGGCVASAPQLPSTQVFDCEGGYRVVSRVEGQQHWLYLPSGKLHADLVRERSGINWVAGEVSFQQEKEEARLNIRGQSSRQCKPDLNATIWEDARFRGVEFRAVGNEPGWYLEIDRTQIFYAGNYGRDTLHFPFRPPRVEGRSARTIYSSSAQGRSLDVQLEAGDCFDSMSGKHFNTRVTLSLDGGAPRYGCGRVLN